MINDQANKKASPPKLFMQLVGRVFASAMVCTGEQTAVLSMRSRCTVYRTLYLTSSSTCVPCTLRVRHDRMTINAMIIITNHRTISRARARGHYTADASSARSQLRACCFYSFKPPACDGPVQPGERPPSHLVTAAHHAEPPPGGCRRPSFVATRSPLWSSY